MKSLPMVLIMIINGLKKYSKVFDMIDGKNTVFYNTPTPPIMLETYGFGRQ